MGNKYESFCRAYMYEQGGAGWCGSVYQYLLKKKKSKTFYGSKGWNKIIVFNISLQMEWSMFFYFFAFYLVVLPERGEHGYFISFGWISLGSLLFLVYSRNLQKSNLVEYLKISAT